MMHSEVKSSSNTSEVFITSLIAGSAAGLACDMTFYPLDTLKTRMQSQYGFVKSGGFKNLYKGIQPVIIGSAPAAALFFTTYDGIKHFVQPLVPQQYHSLIHMSAASLAEMAACLVRVPVEVVKQRRQAHIQETERLKIRTLFRGYTSTVLRDMPFGFIQMPIWEYFKLLWRRYTERECTPMEGAIFGGLSVAIASVATVPLDVAKTRIMLSSTTADTKEVKISTMLKEVYRERGIRGLFIGTIPRTAGFTIGGTIYFGVYEYVREFCENKFRN